MLLGYNLSLFKTIFSRVCILIDIPSTILWLKQIFQKYLNTKYRKRTSVDGMSEYNFYIAYCNYKFITELISISVPVEKHGICVYLPVCKPFLIVLYTLLYVLLLMGNVLIAFKKLAVKAP